MLPTSALFSLPFDHFASVGKIVLVVCLKRLALIILPRRLSLILTIRWHDISLHSMLLRMVCATLQNLVYHRSRDVWAAYQAMQDSHLCPSRELVEITCSVIMTTWSSVQYPGVWNTVLPQSDNSCKCLPLLIQYPELLNYYRMVCCCEI